MRIIDNRYKIERKIEDNIYSETYLVSDLWGDDRYKVLKFYNYDEQKSIIDYFITNFIQISNVRHSNILWNEKFNIVKTIDTKKTNMLLYYSISEYINAHKLSDIGGSLGFFEKLRLVLDILITIDYLHFRGYTYQILSPAEIYVLEDKNIKLMDIATIIEKRDRSYIDDFNRYFISPETLINKNSNDKRADYYSIGIIMKYLLLEDYFEDDVNNFVYVDEKFLDLDKKDILNKTISQLTKRDFISRDINLIEIVDKIIEIFELDYPYDLVQSRNTLFFNNRIIGREKEIEEIMSIDESLKNGNYKYKGLILKGEFGVGKTKLLTELTHRLKMKGRDVYYIEIEESKANDLYDLTNILKQSLKDTPSELMEKYRDELCRILPELRLYGNEVMETDLSPNWEMFRLCNRISNYFTELSKENIIYIVIDDLQYANINLLTMIDYLLKNIRNNNLFFIFSYDSNLLVEESSIKKIVEEWNVKEYVYNLDLLKLNLEEIGQMVQNILGISYVPSKLASVLFKESQGNPRYIEYLIKHLYASGELYMNPIGKWYLKADSYSEIYFPSNLDEAFEKQLKLVRDNYFEIFKILSVFDDALYKRILLNMLDLDGQAIDKQLNQLKSLGLIDEKLGDWGYSYNVKNTELKRKIYNEIPHEEKIQLHKKASLILSDLDKDSMEFLLEELLHHLIKSNQANKAIEIILERLEQIENIYSPQGRFLLEKAYSIMTYGPPYTKLKILENLVQIHFLKGESDKGKAYLEEYQSLALELKDYKHIIKGKLVLIDLYYLRVETEKALKEIEEIEEISKEYNFIEGQIIAYNSRARISIQNGNLEEAETNLKKAIELSNAHNIDEYLGPIYNRLGIIRYLNGNMEEAIEYYDKSIEYCQATGNIVEATKPLNNIGSIYLEHFENPKKAMEYFEKGKEIATKLGIQEAEIVFLNNIAELFIDNYQYDLALEYLEEAKKGALELQDLNMIFLANLNMGSIYLAKTQYDKAYECIEFLQEVYSTNQITKLEITYQYYDFLGYFYGTLGDLEKSVEYSQLACDICKDFNIRGYLVSKARILAMEILKSKDLNKADIEEIRLKYRERKVSVHRRRFLLQFAIISILANDLEYAKEFLEEDSHLMRELPNNYLDLLHNGLLSFISSDKGSIKSLIDMEEKKLIEPVSIERLYFKLALGYKLFYMEEYIQSLKYLFEALDLVYKITLRIPYNKLKFSFIRSRDVDILKDKIRIAIKKVFGYEIGCTYIDDVDMEDLNIYFDLKPIIDLIGSDDFISITQFDYYGEAVNINTVEELISKFTDDYQHNLDLILKYLSKITFAKKGFILSFDEKSNTYEAVAALNNGSANEINERFLSLAGRTSNGILINKNYSDVYSSNYLEFLKDDKKGIMCVPISSLDQISGIQGERRKNLWKEYHLHGFIYLETDNVFNRFDIERLAIVRSLSYLIYINLENNKLRLMATTDKLTNTLTRKYFETKFEEIINSMKSTNRSFSVFMLDIDRFKRVNDTYGHRKGDEILSIIGSAIKSSIRSTDIVGRYGGEEFIIILKDVTEEEAINVAEKIRSDIEKLEIKGIEYPITVSIGISLFPNHSHFSDDLIEKADQALYYAKESGRNKIFMWNPEMNNTFNRGDKLAGIVTGDLDSDNRNILALIDIIELIKDYRSLEENAFVFLGRVLETIDGEYGTILLVENEKVEKAYTRERFSDSWVDNPSLNNERVLKAIESKKGEFFIDWENLDNIDSISGLPNWQSVIILPLIKKQKVKGVLYVTVSLRKKEFDFNSFNLAKYLSNVFAALL
ncbi:MAG: diguanylate cyclase [Tissierellia bacterium]|nr:diguanylate cyclase [Tissierellia bacterium]